MDYPHKLVPVGVTLLCMRTTHLRSLIVLQTTFIPIRQTPQGKRHPLHIKSITIRPAFNCPKPKTTKMDNSTQTYADPEHNKVLTSTGSRNATPDTVASTDIAETTSPIRRSYPLLTPLSQHFPEQETPPVV